MENFVLYNISHYYKTGYHCQHNSNKLPLWVGTKPTVIIHYHYRLLLNTGNKKKRC